MREQVFHLVRQNPPRLQVDVFRVGGRERHRDELDPRLLRRAPALEIVAAPARRHHVGPHVAAALAEGRDVIPGQVPGRKLLRTIHAQIRIPLEQRPVVERRRERIPALAQFRIALGGNNGVDLHNAAQPRPSVPSATDPINRRTANVGNPRHVVQPHGVTIVDPLQGHACDIGAQNILSNSVRLHRIDRTRLGRNKFYRDRANIQPLLMQKTDFFQRHVRTAVATPSSRTAAIVRREGVDGHPLFASWARSEATDGQEHRAPM